MGFRVTSRCSMFLILFVASLLLTHTAVAQPTIKFDLSGHWQGVMMKPDGEERVVLTMKKDRRAYQGRLSLMDKPGLELYLDYMYLKGSRLRFDRSNREHSYDGYEGTLSEDGQSIDGAWFHYAKPMRLVLHRVHDGEPEWQVKAPTATDLHNLLQAAWKQSALTRDGVEPFHLTAEVSVNGVHAVLDELWKDSLHWRMALNADGKDFIQVSNGPNSYTSGQPPIIPVSPAFVSKDDHSFTLILPRIQEALFSSVRPELRNSLHVKVSGGTVCDNNIIMDCTCLKVQPELKGMAQTAETEYCLSAYDGRIRSARYPPGDDNNSYGNDEERDEFSDFSGVNVSRKITIATSAFALTVQLRVLDLTSATDLSLLDQKPSGAFERTKPFAPDDSLNSQLMIGQTLSSPDVPWKFCVNLSGQPARLRVLLHVEPSGTVKGFDVLDGPAPCMDATHREALSQLVQKFQYRSSYRNNRAVPMDRTVRIGHDPGEYD